MNENKARCLNKIEWDYLRGKSNISEEKLMNKKYLRMTENAKYSSKIYQLYQDWLDKQFIENINTIASNNISI